MSKRGLYRKYLYSEVSVPKATLKRLKDFKEENTFVDGVPDSAFISEMHEDVLTTFKPKCSNMNSSSSEWTNDLSDEEVQMCQIMSQATECTNEDNVVPIDDPQPCQQPLNGDNNREIPLCSCTSTTQGEALIMVLALASRHYLPWSVITDILCLINKLFNNRVISETKYSFLKDLNVSMADTLYHVYCPECESYLGTKQSISSNQVLSCKCGVSMQNIEKANTFFLTLGMESQLRSLLEDEHFRNALNYRFQRTKTNPNAFEDIYDGAGYKMHFDTADKILSQKYNLSYCFNTDGVPLGKSSKQTMWPIYLTVNELPPKMRSKYTILAGIYVGKKDPNMNIFLYPFVTEANVLSCNGIDWNFNGSIINSKIIPLCACVDSVARCQMLNMLQFNGFYGCTVCYNKSTRTQRGLRFTINSNTTVDRTHDSIIQDAATSLRNRNSADPKKRKSHKGVKGPTSLQLLKHFNLADGMVPDYMHSVLLGNIRQHTEFLLKSVGKKYYIGAPHKIAIIDHRLMSIAPPKTITRTPRSLKEVSLWKASEWRSWLLFYSIPCLKDILPKKYRLHLGLLSNAIYILLQKSVSAEDLDRAHFLIVRYVFLHQKYFKEEAMVYNVHLLLHMKKGVLNWGPLWTHNTFAFEGQNRHLLQIQKSCARVAEQVVKKYKIYKSLPHLYEEYKVSHRISQFCERLTGGSREQHSKYNQSILIGCGNPYDLKAEENEYITTQNLNVIHVKSFQKLFYNGIRYTTSSYSTDYKNNDSYILLQDGRIGIIVRICEMHCTDANRVILFVKELVLHSNHVLSDEISSIQHVKCIMQEGGVFGIEPSDIQGQCVAINFENTIFVCSIPYGCSGD